MENLPSLVDVVEEVVVEAVAEVVAEVEVVDGEVRDEGGYDRI